MSFRSGFNKSLQDLIAEESKKTNSLYLAERRAKKRLRMYANLFTRDIRSILINENSVCLKCNSKENLQVDHIVAIANGGKNEISNTQILCFKCNRAKSDK